MRHNARGPAGQRRFELLAGHGGRFEEVLRAARHGNVDERCMRRKISRNARVDDLQPNAVSAAEHIDGCTAAQEVMHHLRGDGLWIWTHARSDDAVIAREHQHGRTREIGRRALLNPADLVGHALERAQTAGRLRFDVNGVPERGVHRRGRRGDIEKLGERGAESIHTVTS